MDLLTHPGLGWPMALELALLAALYALVGRAVGAGVPMARSIGFPAVVAVSGLLCGLPGVVWGIGWSVTRSLDFKAHAATPTRDKHFGRAAIRLLPMLGAAIVMAFLGEPYAILAAFAAGVLHLMLAGFYGDAEQRSVREGRPIGKQNWFVEIGQAAVFGAALALGTQP